MSHPLACYEGGKVPLRTDGSIAFEALKSEHRREYLDGWANVTIGVPAAPVNNARVFFNFGQIEAHAQAAK